MASASFDLCKSFLEELNPDKLQRSFLGSLLKLQNVQRGSIWVKEGNGYLCVEAIGKQSEQIKGVKIESGKESIVGWVIENGRMTIAEGGRDSRHYKELEAKLDVKSTLILCFPLFLKNKEVYGAVQIIDTTPGGKKVKLEKEYLQMMQDLVDLGSIALSNSLIYVSQVNENRLLHQTLKELAGESPAIGQSPIFLDVLEKTRSYAQTDFPVLITGESGTGKEVVAGYLHRMSRRKNHAFVVQNCSAIPETLLESELFGYKKGAFTGADKDKQGLFQAADGGTVFLDEIGDMPLNLQARILRVMQDGEIKSLGDPRSRKVDVRVVSATHRDLATAVANKSFREDLFYRLSVLPLHLPPLRERQEDIPLLFNHFLQREALKMGMEPKKVRGDVLELIQSHRWKGNVRELENFVKYILVVSRGNEIVLEDLPDEWQTSREPPEEAVPPPDPGAAPSRPSSFDELSRQVFDACPSWEELEKSYVLHLLEKNRWNITKAARHARVNRSTFASRMTRLGIKK